MYTIICAFQALFGEEGPLLIEIDTFWWGSPFVHNPCYFVQTKYVTQFMLYYLQFFPYH